MDEKPFKADISRLSRGQLEELLIAVYQLAKDQDTERARLGTSWSRVRAKDRANLVETYLTKARFLDLQCGEQCRAIVELHSKNSPLN